AEKDPFSEDEFGQLMGLAKSGISRLVSLQKTAVA
ncbi:MAG: ribonuclease PH, partial [Rhizobiales bacterium]|nr:ribonuclease PH [Hyphomicrobiales bacterium]